MKKSLFVKSVLLSAAISLLPFGPAVLADQAAVVNYPDDAPVQIGSHSLIIKAGSVQEGLETTDETLTVTVPPNEALILVSPGLQPEVLENDGGLPTCRVVKNRDNQILIQGPRTITFRPSIYRCDTTNYSQDTTHFVSIFQPMANETLTSGQSYQIFWQNEGQGANVIRIRLSVDNGATFDTSVVESLPNNGFFQWTVPTVYTTDQARLKIEGMDGSGNIKSMSVTPAFRIEGETPPPPPPPPSWDFLPDEVTAAASSIDVNQGWAVPPGGSAPDCAGLRIKTAASPAVYYCGLDGKRHAFPNQKIHASWYGQGGNWGGVVTVSDSDLASLPLGANVTYRPGVRMVKLQTDPKTYAVAANGALRWVPSEEAAVALYGANWSQQIDDMSDAFFADYTVGAEVTLK